MHLGVLLRHLGPDTDTETVRAAARSADVLGYHSLWAVDPRLAPASGGGGATAGIEPVAALVEAAACTERVRLGLHVMAGYGGPEGTGPLLTAGLPATLAPRLTVAFDVGSPDLDEATVDAALVALRRHTHSLLVSTRSRQRWGRFAPLVDGWLVTGAPGGVDGVDWRAVLEAAVEGSVDPSRLSLVVRANVLLADQPLGRERSTFCGSVDQVVDDLVEVAGMGADSAVLAMGIDLALDDVLAGYAAIAEGLELRSAVQAPRLTGP